MGFNCYEYIDAELCIADWLSFTVDKDLMLHGASLLGNDGCKFSVTVKVSVFASPEDDEDDDDHGDHDVDSDDEIVVASTYGTYISERRGSGQEFHHGYDVKFDEPVAVDKDLLYFIISANQISEFGSSQSLRDSHITSTDCLGKVQSPRPCRRRWKQAK